MVRCFFGRTLQHRCAAAAELSENRSLCTSKVDLRMTVSTHWKGFLSHGQGPLQNQSTLVRERERENTGKLQNVDAHYMHRVGHVRTCVRHLFSRKKKLETCSMHAQAGYPCMHLHCTFMSNVQVRSAASGDARTCCLISGLRSPSKSKWSMA